MVPAAVGLEVLATPVVRLVFEHGEFTAADTPATAQALVFYAPGIVGYAAVRLTAPVFYAFGNSLTPAGVSVATVAVNVGLNLALVRVMGYPGLALGTSLASWLNAGVLLVLLHRRLGGIDARRLADRLGRTCLAAGVMGAAVAAAEGMAGDLAAEGGLLIEALVLGGEIMLGLVVLAAAARLLGIAELDEVRSQLLGRPGAGAALVRRGRRARRAVERRGLLAGLVGRPSSRRRSFAPAKLPRRPQGRPATARSPGDRKVARRPQGRPATARSPGDRRVVRRPQGRPATTGRPGGRAAGRRGRLQGWPGASGAQATTGGRSPRRAPDGRGTMAWRCAAPTTSRGRPGCRSARVR